MIKKAVQVLQRLRYIIVLISLTSYLFYPPLSAKLVFWRDPKILKFCDFSNIRAALNPG